MGTGKFIWRITNYSERRSERIIYSDVFSVGGCKWRLIVYPKGDGIDFLPMYLGVADKECLPSGWIIDAKYSLTVVNQLRAQDSNTYEIHREFSARQSTWGFQSIESLSEVYDSSKGHLVNDTLVVEAEIKVLNVTPPTIVLDTFFSNLNNWITISDAAPGLCLESGQVLERCRLHQTDAQISNKSLRDCLSHLFELNMNHGLPTSLCRADQSELSSEQLRAVELFWGCFLSLEQEKFKLEQLKFDKDQLCSSIKKNYETYLSKKQHMDDLTREEEEHKMKMEEAKSRKAKLIIGLENLMKDSEEAKTNYTTQEKKLAEAEEKMRRSTAAWSSFKAHFL